jgi:deazaflavin-dependent oxidoreductase (nitroreductase family)
MLLISRTIPTSLVRRFWRIVNPIARPFAGFAPWWVLVETTGRRSGRLRRTPLAAGPRDAHGMLLIAVHGRHSGWVLNLEAEPRVRVRHKGRWRAATAVIRPFDAQLARTFNVYARSGPRLTGYDPVLVAVTYDE